MKYSGADWIKKNFNVEMSELGKKVADILGQVFYGIYNLDSEQLKKVNWDDDYYIAFKYNGTLSNFDFNHLTELLVLCFDNEIRIGISACNKQYIELIFHDRRKDCGYIDEYAWDYGDIDELEIECNECGNIMVVTRETIPEYITKKKENKNAT